MGVGNYVFWLIFLTVSFQVQFLKCQNLTCNLNDLTALEDFMKGLDSSIDGWNASDCCAWSGLSCNNESRVTRLEIVNKRLRGNISESLGGLDQLKILNLSQNLLNGSLPLGLFQLQKLEVLDVSYNGLTGFIPVEASLPSLQKLDVSENYFSGSITPGICVNSTQIRVLNFSTNGFGGDFPVGFGNCTFLQRLAVNSNHLTGNLPEDVFSLKNLIILFVQDNKLSGPLSDKIRSLSSLVQLDISINMFAGSLPDGFDSLKRLEQLTVHSNNFTGTIPTSLSNSPSIQVLSLRNNSLNGSINLNCTAMISLRSLDLGSNKFIGPFPEGLSSCQALSAINFARNNLDSQIPESFKNMQSLSYLSLSRTGLRNISGALSILQHCRNLTTIVFPGNFNNEVMPADLNVEFENLRALVIANCDLTGIMPRWLQNSSNLQLLDLSWNSFSGTIPHWFGSMKFLFYLDLSNNAFSGDIPSNLAKLESLVNGTITVQEPSPDFPFFIRRSTKRGQQYNQILSFPPTLDLGFNSLRGPILPELGNLKQLLVLDLRSNLLSGPIPSELSNMRSLVTLDLSNNTLSGDIPASLTNLSFMSTFSVAYNQLEGRIPTGGQFFSFPNSSFEGNSGLCGEHVKPCPADQNSTNSKLPTSSPHKARKKTAIIIGVVVGIGLGTVFLLILTFCIVTRSPRRKQVDAEKSSIGSSFKDIEMSESRSVVLFEFEETNGLFIEDLLKSTDNFDQSNIVGCGGFGLVYKATLPDGRKVAIKRLSGDYGQIDREFRAEVEALSRAQHENLVLLEGYCSWKNDRLLIYSYMENGSLDYWLHEKLDGSYTLDWETRLRIMQGAAKGLAYLHLSCDPHILHRDVKSSNILLDENFNAHLADFGLARLILPYETHVSTDLVGTLGYIPPEYGTASVATFKGDIYSFGVVLIELLTGKRPMDMCKPKDRRNVISWVLQMKKEKKEAEVIDSFIYDKQHEKQILRALDIACMCLSESPKARPSTQQIVTWLEDLDSTMLPVSSPNQL